MKPTLVILAAGMGSRYGGLKQLDPVGPNDEVILDYSIYDAMKAGFGKVVFVIREDMEEQFKNKVSSRFNGSIPVEYVHQKLSDLPNIYNLPSDRAKPWGTGHAIWACRHVVDDFFCVINADDFYGSTSFKIINDFIQSCSHLSASSLDRNQLYSLVGYELVNTLSEHGSVSRGICDVDKDGFLKTVVERTSIAKEGDQIKFLGDNDQWYALLGNEPVSINLWGFGKSIFEHLERLFSEFLGEKINDPKAEFFIPTAVDQLIVEGEVKVKVLHSTEKWFGVTHPQDKALVKKKINDRINMGHYPQNLWGEAAANLVAN